MFFKKKTFNATYDFLIVGLGNPESKYEATRHNAGFRGVDALCAKLESRWLKMKFNSLLAEGYIGEHRVLLQKPQTYMNNSGEAVRDAMRFYKLSPENVIVIFDDISLDVGKIRLRRNGSDGGQKGMRSIIELTGSQDYKRIKIGIGKKPHPDYDLADWVLSKFSSEEEETLKAVFEKVARAAESIVKEGMDKAMNKFSS